LGNALTFSLLWRFECGLAGLSGLSLAAGVALIRALRQLGVNGAQLKWPNDVLGTSAVQGGRGKLAGILIEAQGDMLGPSAVVIGVGLNLALPQQVLQRIEQSATDLAHMTAALPERNLMLAQLLGELGDVLHEFAQHGFAGLRAEWESYHCYQNKTVQLLMPDGKNIHGTVRGVTDEGALLLEIQNRDTGQAEMRVFHAGEISLRGDRDAAA
jgi:BirA family biotin operon repressor/biotin-[acetyl-CoA-carboxylase] ligase